MLKSFALAGAIALSLMALPAQAAITIIEDAGSGLPTGNSSVIDLSGLPLIGTDVSYSFIPAVDKADTGPSPLTIAGPGANPGTSRSFSTSFELPTVPEPATWGMILAGLCTIGYTMRRQGALNVSFA